ncbi:Phage integrase family protein [Palleronia salina]|uniref:Phage integrase family protein n=1 Tax=Palleronia salina TaxID=313368 RepID=A0A1M6M449_9RHOB|nr:site-specific integrase [Palleronia salina]SHJ78222.1 Phage integrase family protein [Palleronia salina]
MSLPKVPGTKVRGTTYHLNLPIPKTVQNLHPKHPTGIMRGTLKTSDPKEAAREVNERRAILERQVKEAKRLADRERLLGTLGQEDRDLLTEIGGPEKLLEELRSLRKQAAFAMAGSGADLDLIEETEEVDHRVMRQARAEEQAVLTGHLTAISGEVRPLKRMAKEMAEDVENGPAGFDEGTIGVREAAEKLADAKKYTVQNRESLMHTARRWIEAHGDIPIEKWTRGHLDQFDELLTRLPSSTSKKIRALPIREAVRAAHRDGLDTIVFKTRKRFSDHMKAIAKAAVNRGDMPADPFAGYAPRGEKKRHSERNKDKTVAYTRDEVGRILDYTTEKYSADVLDYWMPILAAYTGARLEELAQLMVSNVRVVGNIHVLDITDMDETQKVKNQHSLRVVPIPSIVVEMGFLQYVDQRRAAGGRMLFIEDHTNNKKVTVRREVPPNKRGRYGASYGSRFSRHVRKPLELTTPGMKFHSLRHSWTDAARRAKIDAETRRLIAGRLDNEDVTEAGYGGDDLLSEKLDALDKVAAFVRS